MKIMSIKEMLPTAQKNGYGIGSFSPRNTFLIEYILRAAGAQKSPVIVQISANEFKWFNLNSAEFGKRFYELKDKFSVPAALHLDHTKDIDIIKDAIENKFTSVMIDASQKEFEENIKITKEVVDYAHERGVAVEAELGRIGAADKIETNNDELLYTDPYEAGQFVERTGVDALAVSIGTAHGVYPVRNPRIDFERLIAIREKVSIPLVLHGGSGLPSETVNKAIKVNNEGVSKINIATDLETAFLGSLGYGHRLSNKEAWQLDPEALKKAGEAVQMVVEDKIQNFVCSSGHMEEFM